MMEAPCYSETLVRIYQTTRRHLSGDPNFHTQCHVDMDGKRGAYRVLVGRPEGWRPLARPRQR
jgi:hypothetical protein